MKITGIDSAAQDGGRAGNNNLIWINATPDSELERSLMRALAGSKGTLTLYNNGNFCIEFKVPRRRQN